MTKSGLRLNGTQHHEADPLREFYLDQRRGLLMQIASIEKTWLPDKYAETLAARRWLEETRSQRIIPAQT